MLIQVDGVRGQPLVPCSGDARRLYGLRHRGGRVGVRLPSSRDVLGPAAFPGTRRRRTCELHNHVGQIMTCLICSFYHEHPADHQVETLFFQIRQVVTELTWRKTVGKHRSNCLQSSWSAWPRSQGQACLYRRLRFAWVGHLQGLHFLGGGNFERARSRVCVTVRLLARLFVRSGGNLVHLQRAMGRGVNDTQTGVVPAAASFSGWSCFKRAVS